MKKLLAAMVLLMSLAACGDIKVQCDVPKGGDVNVLGRQNP